MDNLKINTMKAAVIKKPGVIEIENVPKPKPKDGEVLLKVNACAICGTDQRVLSGEKHVDVPIGLNLLARDGHLSLFAGMPKSNPLENIDLNHVHYLELHIHGANSSVKRDYIEARDYLAIGKINGQKLVTHHFKLDDFNKAVETQKTPSERSLKIIITP